MIFRFETINLKQYLKVFELINHLHTQFNLIEPLFEQLDIILWIVDKNLVFTSTIGGGLKNLGLTKNQIVGLSLFEYFQTSDKNFEPIAKHIEAMNGQKVNFIYQQNERTFRNYLQPLINSKNEISGVIGLAVDITEEVKHLEELKSSEEKYKALFSSSTDAILLLENDFIIDCNPAALSLLKSEKENILNHSIFDFSPALQPDGISSTEKISKLIEKANQDEQLQFEWVFKKSDNSYIYTEVRLNRIVIKEKYYLLSTIRDISAKKEQEKQIKLLANALESVNECVSITNLENNIIYVNKKFADVYGYTKEELIQLNISKMRSERNDPSKIKEILPETIKGGWKGELWNRRKNGEEFLIRLSTSPVYDEHNKIIALIGVATDITQEKELFNKIKYDAERLKILFENAPEPIFVFDFEGKIIEANKACEILTGWTRNEAYNKTFSELNIFDKPNLFKALKVLVKSLNGEITGPTEFIIYNRKGEQIFVDAFTHPIEIEGRKYVLCVARNITERKKILLELARAKEEAENANRQKTLFFAAMSHEIRTPINAILGFNEVLKDIFYEKSDAETKRYFEILENAAKTLLHTISQLLDLSRIESGSFKYQIKELDIRKEIIDVVELLKMLAEKKNLKIVTNLPETQLIVKADQYTLNGIISNILSNAIKYTDKGNIYINLTKSENFAICEIRDEGIGMSEEFQKRLFTNFVREERVFSRKVEGSGLGLVLTKKYVEINKGKISITSKRGVGTTVTFTIPLAK